jgi:hypothetical protein
LQRRSGQTPLVLGIQSESSFSGIGTSFLDVVRFIEYDPGDVWIRRKANKKQPQGYPPVPLESMHRALFRDEDIVPPETLDLFTEGSFKSSVRYQYLYIRTRTGIRSATWNAYEADLPHRIF